MTPVELKRRRVAARLTQVEVGERLGVTGNTVARWERGEVRITPAMARLIALTLPLMASMLQKKPSTQHKKGSR